MKDDSSQKGWQFNLIVILILLTVLLGLYSFCKVFPGYPFMRKLYYTFQLFSMESGDRLYENGPQPLNVRVAFNIARFSAIAAIFITIIVALLSVLKSKYYISKVRHMKDHTILCGLGNLGNAFASNIGDKSKLVIIESDANNESLLRLTKEGVKVIEANALDITVLGNAGIRNAKCMLALTGNDFDNMSVLNNAFKLLGKDEKAQNRVCLACNIDSRNLKTAVIKEWINQKGTDTTDLHGTVAHFYETALKILAQKYKTDGPESRLLQEYSMLKEEISGFDPSGNIPEPLPGFIRLFNINQLAARYIFINYPPDRYRQITSVKDKEMEILILGYSPLGEELFKLFVQNCHFINKKSTKLTIICIDGNEVNERIVSKYPNVRNAIDLKIIEYNPHHIDTRFVNSNNLADVDAIYVCSMEDRFQASYSSRALELYKRDVYIVRPFYRNTILNIIENKNRVHSFYIYEKVSKTGIIKDDIFDSRARAFHNRWLKIALNDYIKKVDLAVESGRDVPKPKATFVPWDSLEEEIRDDNRSVVDHLNVKLRSAGQLKNPEYFNHPEEDKQIDYSFLKDQCIVDSLAETEHRRWMANKYLYGWEYGPVRNDIQKIHSCMKDYSDLDHEIKEYDLMQVSDMKDIIINF